VFILLLAGTCDALLDFFVRQDLDRIFGKDVAQARPDGGCCDEVSALSVYNSTKRRNDGPIRKGKKKNKKNIQQLGFAGGHPPNY
jgi:hypothetical protein